MYLNADLSSSFLPTSSEFQDATGITARNFRKGLISTGSYINPRDGESFTVDDARIAKWAENFRKMQDAGVSVPLVASHDARDDPSTFLGYLHDIMVDDDGWLSGIVGLRGKESIETAQRIGQVSVEIEDFTTGSGNRIGEAITRIALTPNPVVPNQRPFEVAASRVFHLSRGNEDMNKDFLQKMASLLGEEVTKDDLVDKLQAKFESIQTPDVSKELQASLSRIKELEARIVPVGENCDLEDRAELYGERLDRLALDGKVPGDIVDKLKLCLLGEPTGRNALMLSSNQGQQTPRAKEIISLLEQIPPRVEFGTKTGPQTKVLDPQGKDGSDGFDLSIHNRMRRFANLEETKNNGT